MVGRATGLVLYLVCACVMMLIVGIVGRHLGDDAPPPPGRLMSSATFGKFQAFSVCVESISGSREEARALLGQVSAALDVLDTPSDSSFTLPPVVDAGCPRAPAHFDAGAEARRVAGGASDPRLQPSPYRLHLFVMPKVTLRMLAFAPALADRRATVEEYMLDDPERSRVVVPVTLGLYASPDEIASTTALEVFFSRSFGGQRTAQMNAQPAN
jgi:hypothetical protein